MTSPSWRNYAEQVERMPRSLWDGAVEGLPIHVQDAVRLYLKNSTKGQKK